MSGSLRSLRELNRLRVLEVFRERGEVSRADIARHTELSRSTVSSLIGELQRDGVVVERATGSSATGGRPPRLRTPHPRPRAVVGLHFDHGALRVAVADLAHTILAEAEQVLDVDHDADEGLEAAGTLVDLVLADAGVHRDKVLGAGVALAGPVDAARGTVGGSTILPGWAGIEVAAELERRIGMPVHVDNDANLGALAESVLGAGRDASEIAYVMLSSGIGAGLILGGRLYRGAGGTAGEIGHVLVDEQGPMCRCGNRGCLETFAGGGALVDLLRRSHGDALSIEGMVEHAIAGDPACQRVLADAGRVVGGPVAALCNQFNPELVVVGGRLAPAGELVLGPMREAVRRYAIPAAAETARIVAGALGARAELLGALVLVIGQSDRALSGRTREAVGR
jgi:predicted NBD/HSP70 family sugar kinase